MFPFIKRRFIHTQTRV